ncbi:hypothetical protein ACFW93_49240 [Streptomyces canus]|uniref:hypothetical protein n=1 Tax=Streptomyces canus TaxID=58343 RepID=UPI00368CFA44
MDAVMEFRGGREAARAAGHNDAEERHHATTALFDDYNEYTRALGLLELECSSPAVRAAAWDAFNVLTHIARRQVDYWDPDWADHIALSMSMPSYRRQWNQLRALQLPTDLFEQSLLAQEKLNDFLDVARPDLA